MIKLDRAIVCKLEDLCYRLRCGVDNLCSVVLELFAFASYLLLYKVYEDLEALLEKVLPKGDTNANSGSD